MSKFSLLEFSKNLNPQFRDLAQSYSEVRAFLLEHYQQHKESFLSKCFSLKMSVHLTDQVLEQLDFLDLEKLYSFNEAIILFLYYDLKKLSEDASIFKPLELALTEAELKVREFSDADKDDFNSLAKLRPSNRLNTDPSQPTDQIFNQQKTLADVVREREAMRLVDPNVIDLRTKGRGRKGQTAEQFPTYNLEEVLEGNPKSVFSENSEVTVSKTQKVFNQQQAFNYQYQEEQKHLPTFSEEEGFAHLVWLSCGLAINDLYLDDREAVLKAKQELYRKLEASHNKIVSYLQREREELKALHNYEQEILQILNHKDTINIARKDQIEQEYHKTLKAASKKVKSYWKERDFSKDFMRKTQACYNYSKAEFERELSLSTEEREALAHRQAIAKEQNALKIIPLDFFSEEDLSLLPLDQKAKFWARVRERESYYLAKLKRDLQAYMPYIKEEYYKSCELVKERNKKERGRYLQPDPLVFLCKALESLETKHIKVIQQKIKEQMDNIFTLLRHNKAVEEAEKAAQVAPATQTEKDTQVNLLDQESFLSPASSIVSDIEVRAEVESSPQAQNQQAIQDFSSTQDKPTPISLMGVSPEEQEALLTNVDTSTFPQANDLNPELEAAILQRLAAAQAQLEAKDREIQSKLAKQSKRLPAKTLPRAVERSKEDSIKARILSGLHEMSKDTKNSKNKEHIQLIIKAVELKNKQSAQAGSSQARTTQAGTAQTDAAQAGALQADASQEALQTTASQVRGTSPDPKLEAEARDLKLDANSAVQLSDEDKKAKQKARSKARKARAKARKQAQEQEAQELHNSVAEQCPIPENPEYLSGDHPFAEDGQKTLLAASNKAFNQEGESLNSKKLQGQRKENNSKEASKQRALEKAVADFEQQQEVALELERKAVAEATTTVSALESLGLANHKLAEVFDLSEDLSIISDKVKKVSSKVNSLDELHPQGSKQTASKAEKSDKSNKAGKPERVEQSAKGTKGVADKKDSIVPVKATSSTQAKVTVESQSAGKAVESQPREEHKEVESSTIAEQGRVSRPAEDNFALDPKSLTAPPQHRQPQLPEAEPLEVRVEHLNKIAPNGLEIQAPYVIPNTNLVKNTVTSEPSTGKATAKSAGNTTVSIAVSSNNEVITSPAVTESASEAGTKANTKALTAKQRKLLATIDQNIEKVVDPLEMEVALAVESSLEAIPSKKKKGEVPLEQREIKEQLVKEKSKKKRRRRRRGKGSRSEAETTLLTSDSVNFEAEVESTKANSAPESSPEETRDLNATNSSSENLGSADSEANATEGKSSRKRRRRRRSRSRARKEDAVEVRGTKEVESKQAYNAPAPAPASSTEAKADTSSTSPKKKRRRRRSRSTASEANSSNTTSSKVTAEDSASNAKKPKRRRKRKNRGDRSAEGANNTKNSAERSPNSRGKDGRSRSESGSKSKAKSGHSVTEANTQAPKKSVVKKFIKKFFGGTES